MDMYRMPDRAGIGVESEGRLSSLVVQTLVANHRQFLSFLEKRVGSRVLAEDILQDAFVRGMSKVDTLRSDESAVAWFYRLLKNAVIDQHRRQGATNRKLEAFGHEVSERSEPDVDMQHAICRCVTELAGTLKREYSEALRLVEIEGLAVKEYALRVGISSSNAGVRVSRARKALRQRVARACGTCADHGCLDCTCGSSSSGCGSS
jgi:RNA polymerase sigma factor (sigma-70 family)